MKKLFQTPMKNIIAMMMKINKRGDILTREEKIMDAVQAHYDEALQYFPENRIVGCFLAGSQNYGLDTEFSDIDTKLIVTPRLDEFIFNKRPISTTHMRANKEQTDFKDIREYMSTFRKQNLNYLEILFTDFKIVNPIYEEPWNKLVEIREQIARYNEYRAIKSMIGIAGNKYKLTTHPTPDKIDYFKIYGYNPKELYQLLRIEEYVNKYVRGVPYEKCLKSNYRDFLIEVKNGFYKKEHVEDIAKSSFEHIMNMGDKFAETANKERPEVEIKMNEIQQEIMLISIKNELKGEI